jgi:hypothetical protein
MFRQPNPVPIVAGHADLRPGDLEHRRITAASERAVDQALADSFPASDPPPWTLGVVYAPSEFHASAGAPPRDPVPTLAGVMGRAWVPIAILIVGFPLALTIGGIVEAVTWLAALVSK